MERVTGVSLVLGEKLNLPGISLESLRKGAILHDIGKIGMPDSILLKPGKLTKEEYEEIKKHSRIGYELCKGLKSLGMGVDLILNHHEKLDGSGYPRGLKGDEIDMPSRILAVSDIFDALISSRNYRKALDIHKAFKILWSEVKEGKIDGDVVEALVKEYGNGDHDFFINPKMSQLVS